MAMPRWAKSSRCSAEDSTLTGWAKPKILVQALGQPGTARGDARQLRLRPHQAAHAAQQFAVEGFGIQHQAGGAGGEGRGGGGFMQDSLKIASKMMQAAAASASFAPRARASVVV